VVVVEVMKKRGDFCNRETRPGLQALMQEEYEAALATSVAIFVAKTKETKREGRGWWLWEERKLKKKGFKEKHAFYTEVRFMVKIYLEISKKTYKLKKTFCFDLILDFEMIFLGISVHIVPSTLKVLLCIEIVKIYAIS
jgi:hypothetical protein